MKKLKTILCVMALMLSLTPAGTGKGRNGSP